MDRNKSAYDQWSATYDTDPNPHIVLEEEDVWTWSPPLAGSAFSKNKPNQRLKRMLGSIGSRQSRTARSNTDTLHMRFHLGALPGSPDFAPDASWRLLRQAPSPMLENLLALPLGVVAATAVGALWFVVTPLRDITPRMSVPLFLLAFAGFVIIHEFIHALVHPMAGRYSGKRITHRALRIRGESEVL